MGWFGKSRNKTPLCMHCGEEIRINPMKDAVKCQHCHQRTPTGNEDNFRKVLEKVNTDMPWPKSVAARAASYSHKIYEFASDGKEIARDEIEQKVTKRFGAPAAATSVNLRWYTGRSLLDMRDSAPGVMLLDVDGQDGTSPWRYVYVVFRGSAARRKFRSTTPAACTTTSATGARPT